MLNTDIKVRPKDDGVCECCDYNTCEMPAPDSNDAKLELTAACAEYVNAVAPGKRFDVKDLGNAVVDFINDYLCLNPDDIPGCTSLAKSWEDIWNEFDRVYKDFKLDKCWHIFLWCNHVAKAQSCHGVTFAETIKYKGIVSIFKYAMCLVLIHKTVVNLVTNDGHAER